MAEEDQLLNQWLEKYKLTSCKSSIIEAGLEEYALIEQLDEQMKDEIIEEADLNKTIMQRVMFKKGVSDVQKGVYKFSVCYFVQICFPH